MGVILVKWPNSYTLTTEATDQEEPVKFACMRNIEELCCLFCISVFLILHLESDFSVTGEGGVLSQATDEQWWDCGWGSY